MQKIDEAYFARQLPLAGFGAGGQSSLRRSTVLVAGLGGTGCSAALSLALAGVGHLLLVDRDVVSLENLHRQPLYAFSDVGRSKAEAAASFLRERVGAGVEFHAANIDDSNAGALLDGVDVAVDCMDNFAGRFALNRGCVERRVPLVHTGSLGWDGSVAVFDSPGGACLECLFSGASDEGLPTCEEVGAINAVTSATGSLGALEAIRLLSSGTSPLLSRMLIWDFKAEESRSVAIAKRPSCSVCGSRRKRVAHARPVVLLCGGAEYYRTDAIERGKFAKVISAAERSAKSAGGILSARKMGDSLVLIRFREGEEVSLFREGGALVRGAASEERAAELLDSVRRLAGSSRLDERTKTKETFKKTSR